MKRKEDSNNNNYDSMSFADHLEELRQRVLNSIYSEQH